MHRFSILVSIFVVMLSTTYGQMNPQKDRQAVLRHSLIGKIYVFDRSKKSHYNRTEITYLGKLKTIQRHVFKILISKWYWGIVPRATNRIVVFNNKNQYGGNYCVTTIYDLPSRIEDNSIVFDNTNKKECDTSTITRVNFATGLPKQIFLKCKNEMGSLYSFSNE
jgi:hypothetical protein